MNLGDVLWMEQLPPTFGEILDPARVSRVLNLEEADLEGRFPVQEASTGLPCIVTPLKNLEVLKRCRVNIDAYYDLISVTQAKAILVFSAEPYDKADLSALFHRPDLRWMKNSRLPFAPRMGDSVSAASS